MYNVIIFTDVNVQVGYGKYAGAYRIASELRSIGATVKVIDYFTRFSEEEILLVLDKFVSKETVFVGIASTLLESGEKLHGFNNSFFAVMKQKIKSLNFKTDLIMGGSRINYYTNIKGIDYYFIGKADISIKEFYLHKTLNKDIIVQNFENRNYIVTDDYPVSSQYFSKTQINYIKDDIIDYGESLPLELARGCIFKCSFCQYDLIGKKKTEYIKSYNILKEELIRNYEIFGTTNYLFTDELINESIDKVEFLHELFTTLPFKITWSAYARLDLFYSYPQMREMLQEAGAFGLVFGIETLNDEAGKSIKKGLGKKRILETLEFLKEKYKDNVVMHSNFIIGLPHETKESIKETINWLSSENCTLDSYGLLPLNLRNKQDGRVISEIALNPDKFGYKSKGNIGNLLEWENENLSFTEAVNIVKNCRNSDKFYSKLCMGTPNMMGRIMNLGYEETELKKIIFKNKSYEESKNIIDLWTNLTVDKINNYKKNIL